MSTPYTSRIEYTTFRLPSNTPLSLPALNQLHDLLSNFPAQDIRNTLLEFYQSYIMHEHDNLPLEFNEMATHFYCLDNFLKAVIENPKAKPALSDQETIQLSDLPLLGPLFGTHSSNDDHTTLFVFIRPTILRDDRFADLRDLSRRPAQEMGVEDDAPQSQPRLVR